MNSEFHTFYAVNPYKMHNWIMMNSNCTPRAKVKILKCHNLPLHYCPIGYGTIESFEYKHLKAIVKRSVWIDTKHTYILGFISL